MARLELGIGTLKRSPTVSTAGMELVRNQQGIQEVVAFVEDLESRNKVQLTERLVVLSSRAQLLLCPDRYNRGWIRDVSEEDFQ